MKQNDARLRRVAPLLCAALALIAGATPARAQDLIGGTVLDAASLRPLAGAQVAVAGTGRVVRTAADGRFRIAGEAGAEVVLRVSLPGYQPAEQTAPGGTLDLRILLSPGPLALDRVVATGSATEARRRALGAGSVRIDAAALAETGAARSVDEMLRGRVPGLLLVAGTGQVGGGARILARGHSTLLFPAEPLLVVDGIVVDGAQATGPQVQGPEAGILSRWNDFDPDEIERIEVVKGAAAAALYGPGAARGVVRIETRDGGDGGPRIGLVIRQGADWFADPAGRIGENHGLDPVTGAPISLNIVEREEGLGRPIFRTGHAQEYDVTASGGMRGLRYFLAAGRAEGEGALGENEFRRTSGRANLELSPGAGLEIGARLGVVSSRADLVYEGSFDAIPRSVYLADPGMVGTPSRGFEGTTPEAYYGGHMAAQGLDRETGSFRVGHTFGGRISHGLRIGLDRTRDHSPEVREFPGSDGATDRSIRETDRKSEARTLGYGATATLPLGPRLQGRTTAGIEHLRRLLDLARLDSTGGSWSQSRYKTDHRRLGLSLAQELGWRERLFVTGAIRRDRTGLKGVDRSETTHSHSVGAAWLVSEESFWKVGLVDALRLRAAWGQVEEPALGLPPEVLMQPAAPEGAKPLRPERVTEAEIGVEAAALGGRLALDLAYYAARTRDLLSLVPGSGFFWVLANEGEIRNHGWEVSLRGQPVRSARLRWDLSLDLGTNGNELASSYPIISGTAIHRDGDAVASWYGRRVVSAELDGSGRAVNALCDGGPDNGGQAVPCAQAPQLHLGRATPSRSGAVASTLTLFGELRLHALVDFQHGHVRMNGNLLMRCGMGLCHEDYAPEAYDPAWIAEIEGYGTSRLVQDAGFARLRELSASWTLPAGLAARLGARSAVASVAGRNLHTWTRYGGLDPEAGGVTGNRARSDVYLLPQLARIETTVRLGF